MAYWERPWCPTGQAAGDNRLSFREPSRTGYFLVINGPTILPVSLRERLLEVCRPFRDQRAIAERSVHPEFYDGTV